MTWLYHIQALQRLEALAQASLPARTLMQRAGLAAAQWVHRLTPPCSRMIVLAGPGNNGGDALETALHLHARGHEVRVWCLGEINRLPAAAAAAYQQAQAAQLTLELGLPAHFSSDLSQADCIIDGLFGIGLNRAPDDIFAQVIRAVNQVTTSDTFPSAPSSPRVFALDVPSGLNADTGWPLDAHLTIRADHTLSLIAAKPGLYTGAGRDYAGQVQIADLQLFSPALIEQSQLIQPCAQFNSPAEWFTCLPRRQPSDHKGRHGSLAVIGGTQGMAGAVLLASRAALKLGAGRVYMGMIDSPALSCDPVQPELMLRKAASLISTAQANSSTHPVLNAIVAGPGMGQDQTALLDTVFQHPAPLLLDADALNSLSADLDLRQSLAHRQQRGADTILTPHPLEAARLLDISVDEVQQNRLQAAQNLAQHYQAMVVLKGSGSLIASPEGLPYLNTTGNAALATAGTGDVLSGMIGALLAQGMPPLQAACAGTWLHGQAADNLVANGIGPIGVTATEMIDAARHALNQLLKKA